MRDTLVRLRKERDELFRAQRTLMTDGPIKEQRAMTVDEQSKWDGFDSKYGVIDDQISNLALLETREDDAARHAFDGDPSGRRNLNDDPSGRRRQDDPDGFGARDEYDPSHGYRNMGQWCQSIIDIAPARGGRTDKRLIEQRGFYDVNDPRDDRRTDAEGTASRAATTFGSELVGSDGGHLVPPDFIQKIHTIAFGEQTLMDKTRSITTARNSIELPMDETTPWGSTGLVVETIAEGGTMTQRKPVTKLKRVELHKYGELVGLTDELVEDAIALGDFVTSSIARNLAFRMTRDIIGGDGAGEMAGILQSNCLIAVARTTGSAIKGDDLLNMWERRLDVLPGQELVWLINPAVETSLMKALLPHAGTLSDVPMFIPPGGGIQSPFGTIFGVRVMRTQACEDLGTKGDIILANMGEFLTVKKAAGPRVDTSIHIWFDQGVTALRYLLRIGGQPWLSAAVSPRAGSKTLSHFVAVAA